MSRPPSPPSLAAFQQLLGAHVRHPRGAPRPPGTTARRVRAYSELVFGNLESIVATCFPVTKAVLGRRWPALVRRFCREGRCESPLFREIPGEFLQWLMASAHAAGGKAPLPPWLCELAHYEWVELAVDTMDVPVQAGALPAVWGDRRLRVNPTAMNLAYHWPVHRIGPAWRPRRPQPTFLLVHRDRHDTVRFASLTAVSSRLLHWAGQPDMNARGAAQAVAAELGHPGDDALVAQGLAQLEQWMDQDVILGVNDDEQLDEPAA